jgi:hypothetical protein
LPVDVSRYFLNTWLEVKNIGFLDQAFCNKNLGNFFLDILNNCIIGREFFDEKDVNFKTDLYLDWISKRKVFVKNLCINEWNESVLYYFQNNENNRNSFLKSLTLNFNNIYDFRCVEEKILIELINSKNFKNLNELCFVNNNFTDRTAAVHITDLTLIAVSYNCKFLKVLKIDKREEITDKGLISIVKNCSKLENISIKHNKNITDLSLIEIAENCVNLKILNLSRC